ncbi:hypothetical protein ABG79_00995 [Caloramator mitchellensis]|uniref:Uncharacterized protein n=1 Tax=Caloramator mitchellensis TaxID=908809 RepID=A0A0R3JXZ4_CALMK|nr:hypothetical protein [Caloramator mitchellensis]KRQ87197.1 hypothetical protein ABG79_00995 [Caloramator mitchellensis]
MRKKFLSLLILLTITLTSVLSPFLDIVNAAPKSSGGGFKSGSFKSSTFNSGGFKSGSFKSAPKFNLPIPKTYQKKSSGSKNYVPIPFPFGMWGSPFRTFYAGYALFSVIGFIFKLLLILFVLSIILKIFRR